MATSMSVRPSVIAISVDNDIFYPENAVSNMAIMIKDYMRDIKEARMAIAELIEGFNKLNDDDAMQGDIILPVINQCIEERETEIKAAMQGIKDCQKAISDSILLIELHS